MASRSWLILSTFLVAASARAEVKIKSARFVDAPERKDDTKLQPRALLEAVVGAPAAGLRTKDFFVTLSDGALPVSIQATKTVPFSGSDEELDVVVLVQANVRFMGDPEPDPLPGETGAVAIDGYYEVVKQAVDVFAKARPAHTRMGLYVYGSSVVEKVPMGPAERVTGDGLGPQKEYAKVTTRALERGLEEAERVLSSEKGRRVLVLIGDGSDQRDGYNVRQDVDRLEKAGVEVYALGASPREPVWADRNRLELLGRLGAYRFANEREQVPQVAQFLANEMNNVYTVQFPDIQPTDSQMLPVDGEEHEFKIKAAGEESHERTIKFPGPLECLPGADVKCVCPGRPPKLGPPCAEPDEPSLFGRLWPLIPLGLGGAVATVLVLRRRGGSVEEPDVEPAPAPAPAPVPAPPPPALDRRTQAIRLDGNDEDDIPIVGWIVPVTGASAYQTFRLSDRTKIGAAPDCEVRIADPHMSGHHAEIVFSAGNFVLSDTDSRNGVTFYDKRISKHTLVDNDLFTCGTTSFKFKWTLS